MMRWFKSCGHLAASVVGVIVAAYVILAAVIVAVSWGAL